MEQIYPRFPGRRVPGPAALVVDVFCGVALEVAEELGLPAHSFFTSGAEVLALFLHLLVLQERITASFQDMGENLVHVSGIPPFPATHFMLPMMDRNDAAYDDIVRCGADLYRSQGIIVNTFRSLEPRAVETVAAGHCTAPGTLTPPMYCIGPCIKSEDVALGKRGKECMSWLDAQLRASVVFVCFGSVGRFSAEQIREVAAGLEASGQRFLWVVRAPLSDDKLEKPQEPDLDTLLPEGFLARTKDRGLVVRSWAPQRDVLAHVFVGGFVTRCGWNSVLEAVMVGVPMVAWPLYAEQRVNRLFLEKEMRLVVAVEGYDSDTGLVAAEEVAAKVRWLMESDGRRMLRERTQEAMQQAKEALREDGESEATLAGMVDKWKNRT